MSFENSAHTETPHKLVIFDMDGTLINSEDIASRAWAHASQCLDRPITADEARDRFHGRTFEVALDEVTQDNGGTLPAEFTDLIINFWQETVAAELQPTDGAAVLLDKLAPVIDICVASNAASHDVLRSLTTAGLIGYFEGRTFNADDVMNGKPAPDLFLKAAARFGREPSECIVLEDSPVGLTAAASAGMQAVGFCGHNPEDREQLAAFGVPVIDTIGDFLEYVRLP